MIKTDPPKGCTGEWFTGTPNKDRLVLAVEVDGELFILTYTDGRYRDFQRGRVYLSVDKFKAL